MSPPLRPQRYRDILRRLAGDEDEEERRSPSQILRSLAGEEEEPEYQPLPSTAPKPYDIQDVAEGAGVRRPLPTESVRRPETEVLADATRVAPRGPAPDALATLSRPRLSPIAMEEAPETRMSQELLRAAKRREDVSRRLGSTAVGQFVGGESQLAAAEGFVQTVTLPSRLLEQGRRTLTGSTAPRTLTPMESAGELASHGLLPESPRLPGADLTKYAGLETRRDVASLLGSLPGITPFFRAAGAVARPAAKVVEERLASAGVHPAMTQFITRTSEEAGKVGLAMGVHAESEALAQGRSAAEALTEGTTAGLEGAVLGAGFGAVRPALQGARGALEKAVIDYVTRPRVGNVADLPPGMRRAPYAEGENVSATAIDPLQKAVSDGRISPEVAEAVRPRPTVPEPMPGAPDIPSPMAETLRPAGGAQPAIKVAPTTPIRQAVPARVQDILDQKLAPAVRDDSGKIWSAPEGNLGMDHAEIMRIAEAKGASFTTFDRTTGGKERGWMDQEGQFINGEDVDNALGQSPTAVPTPSASLELRRLAGEDAPATHTVTFSDGRKVGIRYRVVDLADLQPSHDPFSFQANPDYPQGVQGRDYAADPSAQEVVKTRAQQLDPDLALDPSLTPDKGPPIITSSGVVVAGNERTMLLRRAAELAPERYAAYVEALGGRVPADVESTARGQPVLVREITDPSIDPTDPAVLRELNRVSDVVDTKSMRGLDDAASRAGQLRTATEALTHFTETIQPDETLADYLSGKAGQTFVQKLVEDRVLAPQEVARFLEPKTGGLTEDGKLMVRRLMLASVVEDAGAISRAPDKTLQKIEHAVPHIVASRTSPEWDIAPQVEGALELLGEAKAKDMALEELLAQSSMFDAAAPLAVANMARFLSTESKKAITEAFRRYGQLAREAGGRAESVDMFEDLTPTAAGAQAAFGAPRRAALPDLFAQPEAVQEALFGEGEGEGRAPVSSSQQQAQRILDDPKYAVFGVEPTRNFQRYSSEDRAMKQASFRQGHRQRQAEGEVFWTHPASPDIAFPTRTAARRAALEAAPPEYREARAFLQGAEPISAEEIQTRPEGVRGEIAEEPEGERPGELFGSPTARPDDPVLGSSGGARALANRLPGTPGVKPTGAPPVIKALAAVAEAAGRAVPIRVGRVRNKNYLGIFKPRVEVIRVQEANDIPTAAHEVAHALQKIVFGSAYAKVWNRPGIGPVMRMELTRLGKALYGNKKPAAGYRGEGWAEFVRIWVTEASNTGTVADPKVEAPAVTKWFEGEFSKDFPEVRKALDKARELARRWQQQGAVQRARMSMVDPASPGERLKRAAGVVRGWVSKEKLIDMAAPLQKVSKLAEERLGRTLSPEEDPYLTTSALRMTHSARTAYMVEHGMIDLAGNVVGPALADIRELVRGKREDFGIYLWARRSVKAWLDPQGERNPGLSLEDAQHIVRELTTPAFELAASKVYEWNEGVLNYAAQASPSFAEVVKATRARDPGDYVPLFREFEEMDARWAKSRGASRSSPVKRFKGSGRRVKDVFQSMIAKAEATVRAAHQRLVLEQIIALSEQTEGLGGLVEEVPPDQRPVLSATIQELLDKINDTLEPMAGASIQGVHGLDMQALAGQTLTFFAPANTPKGQDPIVPIWDQGKLRWFQVDERLYRTLNSLDIYRLPLALDVLFGKPARLFRAGTTGLRASFGLIWNPIRDIQTFYVNTRSHRNPVLLMGSYFGALRAAVLEKTGLRTLGRKVGIPSAEDPHRDAFLRLGGEMAMALGQDIPHTRRAARRLFEGTVVRTLDPRNWFDWYRDIVQVPESVPRVAELKEIALQIGWKPGQPMTFAQSLQLLLGPKQVTTDFTAAGEFGRVMNQIAPFHNAAIQGPRAHYRAFKRNPGLFAGRVAQLAALSLLLYWQHKDEEWYKALEWKERLLHWHFRLKMGDRTEVIRIPRAFEIGLLSALPEVVMEGWREQDPEAATAWMKEVFAVAAPNITPVLLDEAFDQYANEDRYFERPIVPRGEEMRDPEAQFGEHTSRVAVAAGRVAGISPRRIDHAIRGLGGPLAGDVAGVFGKGAPQEPQATTGADLPLVGRLFVRDASQPKAVRELYDAYDQAERRRQTWKSYLKGGNVSRANSYFTEHEDAIALVVTAEEAGVEGPLRDAYQQIVELRDADAQARRAGDMDARRQITQQMQSIAEAALRIARARRVGRSLARP